MPSLLIWYIVPSQEGESVASADITNRRRLEKFIVLSHRKMLHRLSEHMVSCDVRQFKHILKNTENIQRSRLEEATDPYALFALLERLEKINSSDVSCLLAITDQMDEAGLSAIVSTYIGGCGIYRAWVLCTYGKWCSTYKGITVSYKGMGLAYLRSGSVIYRVFRSYGGGGSDIHKENVVL